jgi:protein-tyrosine phosphatase
MRFVDLHSHVLPALDDGVPTLEVGLAVVRALGALGFETICATPHQKESAFLPTRQAIDSAYETVVTALGQSPGSPRLLLGAESYWDGTLWGRLQGPALPTYTGGRAFLFELDPRMCPPRLEETLFQLQLDGKLPVMAHPERYQPFWEAPERLEALGRTAALVVDLGALDGAHGRREQQVARRLVEEGLAHACASDAHSVADVRSAAAGIAWIRKRLGPARLEVLLGEAPRQILNGERPD